MPLGKNVSTTTRMSVDIALLMNPCQAKEMGGTGRAAWTEVLSTFYSIEKIEVCALSLPTLPE